MEKSFLCVFGSVRIIFSTNVIFVIFSETTITVAGRIAKIIKLADLFDIIVKNNCLENPDNPYINLGKSIDTIVSSSFVNARLANILKTIVPIYQVGMQVLLSDGTVGIIKANDANDYNTPTVVDLNGKEIDLRDENITVLKQSD